MKSATKIMIILLGIVVYCALTQGMKAVAASEGIIELKYGSQYPQAHPYAVADQHWIDKIEKETNGRVKIKPYWAETLLTYKDSMDGVAKGTVDIGSIILFETGLDLTKALIGISGDRQAIN